MARLLCKLPRLLILPEVDVGITCRADDAMAALRKDRTKRRPGSRTRPMCLEPPGLRQSLQGQRYGYGIEPSWPARETEASALRQPQDVSGAQSELDTPYSGRTGSIEDGFGILPFRARPEQ